MFLAADATRLQELDEAVRRFLAWESIIAEQEHLNLAPQQVRQANTQREVAAAEATTRIPGDLPLVAGAGPARPARCRGLGSREPDGSGPVGGACDAPAQGAGRAHDRLRRDGAADGAGPRSAVARQSRVG